MKQIWSGLKCRKGWFHILTYITWILRMKQLFLRVALNYQIPDMLWSQIVLARDIDWALWFYHRWFCSILEIRDFPSHIDIRSGIDPYDYIELNPADEEVLLQMAQHAQPLGLGISFLGWVVDSLVGRGILVEHLDILGVQHFWLRKQPNKS